jgi:N-acetylglutamate synthase-like GNAT family acetyltransferase
MPDLGGLLEPRVPARVREGSPGEVRDLVEAAGLVPPDDAGVTLVVDDEGGPGATATVESRDGWAYLSSIAVRRDLRGRGLGVALTAAAARRAAAEGARTAALVTETAEAFFARLGFEPTVRGDLPPWIGERATECPDTAATMRRALSRPQ